MKVKELIEKLQTFDPELLIVISDFYETETPAPRKINNDYSTTYWEDGKIVSIPRHTDYLQL